MLVYNQPPQTPAGREMSTDQRIEAVLFGTKGKHTPGITLAINHRLV